MAIKRNPIVPEEAAEWSGLEDDLTPEGSQKPSGKEEFLNKMRAVKRKEASALTTVTPGDIPKEIRDQIAVLTGDPDFLSHNQINQQQLRRLLQANNILLGGVHRSVAMICNDGCMLRDRCPLFILGQAPYQQGNNDSECPVEHQIITQMEGDYVYAYANRQNQNSTNEEVRGNRFVMDLIGELIETHIMENRINTKMARDGILVDQAVAINNEGEMATNQEVSPLFRIKMQLKKKRENIFKQLLLSPEMELKRKIVDKITDPASKSSDITTRAKSILDKVRGSIIDAKTVGEDNLDE